MRLSSFLVLGLLVLTPVCVVSAQQRSSFRYSNEMRAQMEALGTTPVTTIPIPVLLGVELSDLTKNFGDPRGDGTRSHEGLDILAPNGTPIVSPTDAVVTRAGNGASSGLYVRTANPGGETFVYMHLSSVADGVTQGTILKRGDVLGFVGNTGNASGGPAHLHFEIRKGSALDPYPRLTQVFTLAERMQAVTQALGRGGSAHVAMWASRFRTTFETAAAQGIVVPQAIVSLLGTSVVAVAQEVSSSGGELLFGETNAKIVQLQKFLIASATGPASTRLKSSGATGYFGPITRAALIEYQQVSELKPTGVIDEATYLQVFALDRAEDSSETDPEGEDVVNTGVTQSVSVFSRDLELGMKGEDVRALQVFLNAHGFSIAQSGDGSTGRETNYFGVLTKTALSKYQAANGIAPAAGYFGPKTRAHVATKN